MNLKQAYSILEIATGASADDVKKQYRKLTKQFHPDINKDPGAEAKFKKINEAYQCINSGKDDNIDNFYQQSSSPFDIFNNFNRQTSFNLGNIALSTTISFKESVIGCQQNLKFTRKTKCKDCHGQGKVAVNNGCDACGGRGQVTVQNGGMIFVQTCNKCGGRSHSNPCLTCHQQGIVDAEVSITVSIPGGVANSNILRLSSIGHYIGSFGPLDQYSDVHLSVKVIADADMILDGTTVVSNISISLLEALQGCKKTINTIMGPKEIEIKSKSKNKEEVILNRLGVNGTGDQKIILDVRYPENVNALIESLTNDERKS